LTEKELIIRLKQGDEPAFRWLVEQHRNRVYYSVLNLLQDPDEAEDAAQETFIQVYESIYSFKEESLLSTWIYRIAIRKALEKIRRKKTRQRLHAVLPWWMPDEKKSEEARYLNPGIKAEDKEKANALFMAIEALPDKQKIAFTLVKVQGMSYDEVCGIMGMGVKAVESLISRAKENLKKKLDQHYKSYN
jgi:RNA polymerase sigma factor (sigma-70 family)